MRTRGYASRAAPHPSTVARALSALRLIHPFPTLMNALATGGLAELATRGRASVWTVAWLMLTMLAIQSTIGIVNDLRDRTLDVRSKPAKPLVRGTVSVHTARFAAVVTLLAAILLATRFGLISWLLAVGGLACGLLYDLWLKRTVASGLPYAVGLPLLPLWVWTATGRFCSELYAVIPLGLLLGLALHLANSLPDFDEDALAGVEGLVHRLGSEPAVALCWGSYALALICAVVSTAWVRYTPVILIPGVALAAAALLGAAALYRLLPRPASLQTGWTLLVVGTAALTLGWLGALLPC
ncbi:MAG TPA: UbiA family prenyltransferase [Solirubrobacteraceae bacterium]|nr:UbiA family prenyltransferase [Solirubrobacteraceae bacterium]